jgi:hypothetical protein
MAEQKYNEAVDALKKLKGVSGVTIGAGTRVIKITKEARVSLVSWGAIDYLKNNHKYMVSNEQAAILAPK